VFAGFRFLREVISLAVRWYLRYGLSYRDVEELLAERGITVDHVTIYRWGYDPDPADPSFCRHGNPNVLTADRPSSALSQGNTGQLTMVEIEPYDAVPPEVSVHRPPATEIKDISWGAEDQAGTPTTG
jgi:hypothetical protein